jgi:hypothetical protein
MQGSAPLLEQAPTAPGAWGTWQQQNRQHMQELRVIELHVRVHQSNNAACWLAHALQQRRGQGDWGRTTDEYC